MRDFRRCWIALAGIALGAVPIGCLSLDTFPGDLPAGTSGSGGMTDIGGTAGTSGTGGSTESTTTTTPIDPSCIPSMADGNTPVADDCGVFVSSSQGNDTNNGTKNAPFKTIMAALASPKAGPRYLCAESFNESVNIGADAALFGGLDCLDDWKWLGTTTKSTLSPVAGGVPLTLDTQDGSSTVNVMVEDVVFDAKAANISGASAVGIIADKDGALTLTRCDVKAGDATDGADGADILGTATAGGNGKPGGDACSASVVLGGASAYNECGSADPIDESLGGEGGIGSVNGGGDGSNGTPAGNANSGKGQAIDIYVCAAGSSGYDGLSGDPGMGGSGLGTISKEGYTGVAGAHGGKGKPGQGGGGGGGSKGGTGANKCPDASNAGGASGGSGGAGGCGGNGGNGGQAGGSSIGIVSLGATLTFVDVAIATGNGGNGGNGNDGQEGGVGGNGGNGGATPPGASLLKSACAGGTGGTGGKGGGGGGGRGGHSIGLAYIGADPGVSGLIIFSGSPGSGGMGSAGAGGDGANGNIAPIAKFD